MPADAVLLSGYAMLLLGVAHGLRALGRRSTSPYASRTLAGHLRATGEVPEVRGDDWPHNEVPRLYAGMALTAALATVALSVAGLVLHYDAAPGAVFGLVGVLAVVTVLRITGSFREPGGG